MKTKTSKQSEARKVNGGSRSLHRAGRPMQDAVTLQVEIKITLRQLTDLENELREKGLMVRSGMEEMSVSHLVAFQVFRAATSFGPTTKS